MAEQKSLEKCLSEGDLQAFARLARDVDGWWEANAVLPKLVNELLEARTKITASKLPLGKLYDFLVAYREWRASTGVASGQSNGGSAFARTKFFEQAIELGETLERLDKQARD